MSYQRRVPNTWWLKRWPYFLFMVRELTSLGVAGYSVFLLFLVYRLGQGREAYEAAIGLIMSPTSIALHSVALVLAVYHTVTWFNVTPKVIVIHFGEERIPGFMIAGAHYAGWLAVSMIVAWAVLGG